MKIEVGKFYKTRDGRKVGPMRKFDSHKDLHPFCCDGLLWSRDGNGYEGCYPEQDLISEWTDEPKEVGTLAEIGAQVGDVVGFGSKPEKFRIEVFLAERAYGVSINADGEDAHKDDWSVTATDNWRIISRAQPKNEQTGPVRTVTRKEIVPGVYGQIRVFGDGEVQIIRSTLKVENIAAAIDTLTAIRDALKENGE